MKIFKDHRYNSGIGPRKRIANPLFSRDTLRTTGGVESQGV